MIKACVISYNSIINLQLILDLYSYPLLQKVIFFLCSKYSSIWNKILFDEKKRIRKIYMTILL